MFKLLKNKRGIITEATAIAIILGIGLVATVHSMLPSTRANFQRKRAVEICEYLGGSKCEGVVAGMSKKEILEYIRDDGSTSFYEQR